MTASVPPAPPGPRRRPAVATVPPTDLHARAASPVPPPPPPVAVPAWEDLAAPRPPEPWADVIGLLSSRPHRWQVTAAAIVLVVLLALLAA